MLIDLIVYTLEIVKLVGSFPLVLLSIRVIRDSHQRVDQSPVPKSANSGAESRHRTLFTPHIIALYESFVVRNGSTDPNEAEIWICSDDFFPATSFFSSSQRRRE